MILLHQAAATLVEVQEKVIQAVMAIQEATQVVRQAAKM